MGVAILHMLTTMTENSQGKSPDMDARMANV